jgi:orotidine-5'-phosphate decarboxylase
MSPKERLIVALDVDTLDKAVPLVESLAPHVGCFKVGLELLTAEGAPQVVRRIHSLGGKIFFDGKFDDIPNTVAGASRSVAALGVQFFDVHASAGLEAMRAAAAVKGKSLLLAVTVLTSMDTAVSEHIYGGSPQVKVLQFAIDAETAGADGIVCSPQELEMLSQAERLRKLLTVTPGVRPTWAAANDQKRVMTPAEAIRKGATHLVVGRPILAPPREIGSPVEAAKRIVEEIAEGMK